MASKIIIEPRGWTATFDESTNFVGYNDEKIDIFGLGNTPEDAKIDLAKEIACYATGDLKTALDELATDEIIRAALKRAEKRVIYYEDLLKTASHKEHVERIIFALRRGIEALRNLISSMQEHTQ